MARVNVDQVALTDIRFQKLGRLYHKDRCWALGVMVYVWDQCQELEKHHLTREEIQDVHPHLKKFDEAVLSADLAVLGEDGTLYIRGTRGRIEWLKERRETGRAGGKLGGRPKKTLQDIRSETLEGSKNETLGGLPKKTPLAPALALKESLPRKGVLQARGLGKHEGARAPFTPAFLAFWEAYPVKVAQDEAWAAWQAIQQPHPQKGVISRALQTQKQSEQWKEDAGRFIPHPAKWIRDRRWEDARPTKPLAVGAAAGDSERYRALQAKATGGGP